jgi:hypothetical protein
MIKNEREYRITKASIVKFQAAVAQLNKLREQGTEEPAKLKLQEAAAKSMLNELKEQLNEYEQLRRGKFKTSALDLVDALPNDLIRARISLGWTQKELAQHLGTSEQQIQNDARLGRKDRFDWLVFAGKGLFYFAPADTNLLGERKNLLLRDQFSPISFEG